MPTIVVGREKNFSELRPVGSLRARRVSADVVRETTEMIKEANLTHVDPKSSSPAPR